MVNGDDIWWVLSILGFDNYVDVVGRYFYKYCEVEWERVENNKSSNDSGNERELNIISGYSRVLEKGSSFLVCWDKFMWFELCIIKLRKICREKNKRII